MSIARAADKFPRTVCGCDTCRVGCLTMPGTCGPGDVAAIAADRGASEADTAWLASHFAAAVGMKAMRQRSRESRAGEARVEIVEVSTITPKLVERVKSPTGMACVFLGEDDRCTIHAVSPYGCSRFDDHQTSEDHARRVRHLFESLLVDDGRYAEMARRLREAGSIAPPVEERREAYEALHAFVARRRRASHAGA